MSETKQAEIILEEQTEVSILNKDISIKFLIKFTLPSILSFFIMYTFFVVDGVFASRGIDVIAFSAVNVVAPFFGFATAIAAMLAMGGCALVAKKKGMGLKKEARENFTLLAITAFVASLIISGFAFVFMTSLLRLLGVDYNLYSAAREYLQVIAIGLPFVILGYFLVQYVIADGRPLLGMIISFSGTIISTILNAIFIFGLDLGVTGLALATTIGFSFIAVVCLIYFFSKSGTLYFVIPKWDIKVIWTASINGLSEAITILAISVTTIVMNNVLMQIIGHEGIAAAGIVMALKGVFMGLYFGYSAGVSPLISYNYGKQLVSDNPEYSNRLKKLFKKSLLIISILSIISIITILSFPGLMVRIFVTSDTEVYLMAKNGIRIASIAFLLMGFNIFATALFTAFNDGKISGFLSLMRTLIFTVILLILLPMAFEINGVWAATPLVEVLSIVLTIIFIMKMGRKYKYIN